MLPSNFGFFGSLGVWGVPPAPISLVTQGAGQPRGVPPGWGCCLCARVLNLPPDHPRPTPPAPALPVVTGTDAHSCNVPAIPRFTGKQFNQPLTGRKRNLHPDQCAAAKNRVFFRNRGWSCILCVRATGKREIHVQACKHHQICTIGSSRLSLQQE